MTFGKAKEIALQLIDAASSDYDESVFPPIADTAQKMIATQGKHIKRTYTVTKADDMETAYDLSALTTDFYQLAGIKLRGSTEPVNYYEYGEGEGYNIAVKGEGIFDIYYYALPTTIDENTADTYEFETDLDTHNAIPYYIGYELTKTDDTTAAQIMQNQWDKYMSLFKDTPKTVKRKIQNNYELRY